MSLGLHGPAPRGWNLLCHAARTEYVVCIKITPTLCSFERWKEEENIFFMRLLQPESKCGEIKRIDFYQNNSTVSQKSKSSPRNQPSLLFSWRGTSHYIDLGFSVYCFLPIKYWLAGHSSSSSCCFVRLFSLFCAQNLIFLKREGKELHLFDPIPTWRRCRVPHILFSASSMTRKVPEEK